MQSANEVQCNAGCISKQSGSNIGRRFSFAVHPYIPAMFDHSYSFSVLERFLRYVQIDTQSDPNSHTFPSTEKQKDLSNMLAMELRSMGIADADVDAFGYAHFFTVTAMLGVPVLLLVWLASRVKNTSGA